MEKRPKGRFSFMRAAPPSPGQTMTQTVAALSV